MLYQSNQQFFVYKNSLIDETNTNRLVEDNSYIPRFTLKNVEKIVDVPINEPIKPSKDLIIKAIKYGMIFLINYKGAEDKNLVGHERVIYFMVYGFSKKGKEIIRGYHLNGWSVSYGNKINKIWRMFRLDRILSMTFTGSFFRLPPAGYNMNDRGIDRIIAKADFSVIRSNQQSLIKKDEIQNVNDVILDKEVENFSTIVLKDTNSDLDLNNFNDNPYIRNMKDINNIRITFMKSIYSSKYIAVIGALGKPGNSAKVVSDKGSSLGVYRVLDSITGDILNKIKKFNGNKIFKVYLFDKKQ